MPVTIAWEVVERWMLLNDDFPGAAKHFGVKENTIRVRAKRYHWALPSVIAKRAAELKLIPSQNGAIIEQSAKTLAERGEQHAKTVFDLASNALKSLKKLPVRNWKDAEIADKAARRAAGMGNDDEGARISIIQLNEAIDSHVDDSDVIEAELIPGNPESQQPNALEQGEPAQQNPSADHNGDSDA